MDNITHSLVGAVLGEAALQASPSRARAAEVRGAAWTVSILANNVPDVDVLYAHLLGGKLGYLLHHRGHTHTWVAALPQAFGVLLFFALLTRWRPGLRVARRDLGLLMILALAGPLVHVWMDGWNLYGIHPAWPWDGSWVYGDRTFIVEPALWALLVPVILWIPEVGWGWKGLLPGLLAAALAAGNGLGLIPPVFLGAVVAATVGILLVYRRAGRGAPFVALLLAVLGVHGMGDTSARVKARVRAAVPGTPHEVIASPFPARPTCWWVMSVEADAGEDRYRVRRGMVALGGERAADCRVPDAGETTAPLVPPDLASAPDLTWLPQFEGSLAELRHLARTRPCFDAFLHFARAPFWMPRAGGGWVYGDVRFDRGPSLGFAEFEDLGDAGCAATPVPGWGRPVQALLE